MHCAVDHAQLSGLMVDTRFGSAPQPFEHEACARGTSKGCDVRAT